MLLINLHNSTEETNHIGAFSLLFRFKLYNLGVEGVLIYAI